MPTLFATVEKIGRRPPTLIREHGSSFSEVGKTGSPVTAPRSDASADCVRARALDADAFLDGQVSTFKVGIQLDIRPHAASDSQLRSAIGRCQRPPDVPGSRSQPLPLGLGRRAGPAAGLTVGIK